MLRFFTTLAFCLTILTALASAQGRAVPDTLTATLIYFSAQSPHDSVVRTLPHIIENRFAYATDSTVFLSIVGIGHVSLPRQSSRELAHFRKHFLKVSDSARMNRIWYYYSNYNVAQNVLHAARELYPEAMRHSHIMIIISEAQFEGLGYAARDAAIVEQPSENGWKSEDGGITAIGSPWYIADKAVHELGHVLGGLDDDNPDDGARCVEKEYRMNVMSYCRYRSLISSSYAHRYSARDRKKLIAMVAQRLKGNKYLLKPDKNEK